jgi:hypothetical protein
MKEAWDAIGDLYTKWRKAKEDEVETWDGSLAFTDEEEEREFLRLLDTVFPLGYTEGED